MFPQFDPMVPALAVLLLALFLGHVALVAYVWAKRGSSMDPDVGVDAARQSGDSAVRCPTCGAANGPNYRFCRACVAELPGATAGSSLGSTSTGRTSR